MDTNDSWFTTLALFNMMIGLTNTQKNKEQQLKQETLEQKLDKIIELLERKQNEH